jgi:ankyrin repeat domain-containing protein 50
MITRFLMADFHLKSLANCLSPGQVRKALANLPSTIDDVYARTMERIKAQQIARRELAVKALMWVTCACRVLSLQDLLHALATDSAEGFQEIEDFLVEPTLLTTTCAGLLVVDEKSNNIAFVREWFFIPFVFHKAYMIL